MPTLPCRCAHQTARRAYLIVALRSSIWSCVSPITPALSLVALTDEALVSIPWEFKDVVFEDVVFDNHSFVTIHSMISCTIIVGDIYYYQTPHPRTPHP